jgi:C4-dicarboxylate-specific signal transduction histidine kinase
MQEQDEIRQLKERIETLERELRTAKNVAWMGLVTSTWGHRIANIAVSIRDSVEWIRYLRKNRPNEEVDEYLDQIYKYASEILDEPIAAPSLSEAPSISLGDFLAEYTRTVHLRHRLKSSGDFHVRLESTVEAHVKANPEWLRRSVDFIVENALEAMQHSPEKVLTISTSLADDGVEIRFGDTGPGIPDALRQQLFRMPIRAADQEGHLGFGLLLAKTIIRAFDGEMRLDDAQQKGATFIISLPKA